ncbi:unnamed protein product [Rotaria magnacalcarata]|uniref:Uncharacterized protein n=1 Tax=Rotaria magnacalcarata TaxID=392030 RepID=A0A815DQZ3_9BILA|nr:unnamed protein product [Rotaria magnacalcarata]CAF1617943.1 unnamed protein product [Rotaria magnacalcarata]CAF2041609.1 unnamed protein product [Rotaria magnacalcarata]CAF3886488.1 unnamed protein product [Rotaria magnacalcarata]CAF3925118.1 unnamed protein product [Rotaria magnacalcarata]
MRLIICLLCIPIILGSKQLKLTDLAVVSSNIDPVVDQAVIDKAWEDSMVIAPATINLLGQVMVVASKVDVAFKRNVSNYQYKYIRYPDSFRATLLQISNDGYRAFLGAHSAMNRIQLYMQQIPRHFKTIIKLLTSKSSPKLISRLLPRTIDNIERIGQTCIVLANGTEKSFVTVMDLLGEVLETTEVTRLSTETDLSEKSIALNVTRTLHADMKREEEVRRQHYEEVRQAVRVAQDQYSRALNEIPTGWKGLGMDLCRVGISVLKAFSNILSLGQMSSERSFSGIKKMSGGGTTNSFDNSQIFIFVSRFAQSLDSFIQNISSNVNQTADKNGLNTFKIVFGAYANMVDNAPYSNTKMKASQLIQRAIQSVDQALANPNFDIKTQFQNLANEARPFIAAEQLSSNNNAPISIESGSGDSSNNELFKAQLAQARLSQLEKISVEHHTSSLALMDQVRVLSAKLVEYQGRVVHLEEVVKMLREALHFLGLLRKNWHTLVEFFTNFSSRVTVGFGETLKTFLDTLSLTNDPELIAVDRTNILELLNGNSVNLHRESYTLFIMARTYFDVSQRYLMPRLAGLSLMLLAENDDERKRLLTELHNNTLEVQAQVTKLIDERNQIFRKFIGDKRAELNEKIDGQAADGNEIAAIQEGEKLLQYENTLHT